MSNVKWLMHDLLDSACWEYVLAQRAYEDAWGAFRQVEWDMDRLLADLRAELKGDAR